ncbi:MAG: DUF4065 domain-containing protein [Flavobacteriaceae bacterium]|nr:DUF4065 domain-containing protein [Flavobacteriaceae bacterium]
MFQERPLYTAAHITNFILEQARHDEIFIDNIKLQKLLYVSFGWCYVLGRKKKLFNDPIQAWRFGPVIPNIYHQYKKFQKGDLRQAPAALYFDFKEMTTKRAPTYEMDEQTKSVLLAIWDYYKMKDTDSLIDLTHQKGTPWASAYDHENRKEISKRRIKKYYQKKHLD